MPTKSIIEKFEREYNKKKQSYLSSLRDPADKDYRQYLLELTDPFKDNLKAVLMDMGKAFKVTTKKGVSEIVSFDYFHRITDKSGGNALSFDQRRRLEKKESMFFEFGAVVEFNLKDSSERKKLLDAKIHACEEEKRLYKEIKEWVLSQEMKTRSAGLDEYHGLDDYELPSAKIECNENDL